MLKVVQASLHEPPANNRYVYEDGESLVLNLGMIAALMLSFVVGMVGNVDAEQVDVSDLLYLVATNENYRNHIDPDGKLRETIGVPIQLTSDIDSSIGSLWDTYTDILPHMSGLRELQDATNITAARKWVDSQWRSGQIDTTPRLPSKMLIQNSMACIILLTCPLGFSMLAIVSLVGLKTRSDPESRQEWLGSGKWLIYLNYAALLVGMVFFFITFFNILVINMPHMQEHFYMLRIMCYCFIPLISGGFCVCAALHVKVWYHQLRRRAKVGECATSQTHLLSDDTVFGTDPMQ
ncbi:hypothetical protein DIPPA_64928 [Diplonema papillatum]|nr:hypothetical protein DIPPA_64928 [Diplonema papillatum]